MAQNGQNEPSVPHGGPCNGQPRGSHGKFVKSLATAQRDAQVADMKNRGFTFREIAAELGIGIQTARDAHERAMFATIGEPSELARATELEKLDASERRLLEKLEKPHYLVQNGRIIREVVGEAWDEEQERYRPVYGEPLTDLMFELQVEDRLNRVRERRAKLRGLDKATKINVQADQYRNDLEFLKEQAAQKRAEVHQLKIQRGEGTA